MPSTDQQPTSSPSPTPSSATGRPAPSSSSSSSGGVAALLAKFQQPAASPSDRSSREREERLRVLERSASVQARVSSGPWSAARASLDGAGSEDDGARRSSGRPTGLGLRDWRKEAALASSPPPSTTLLPPGSASRPVTERRVSQDLERLLGAKVGGGSQSAPPSTVVSPALPSASTGKFEVEQPSQPRPKKLSLEPPAGLEGLLRSGPPCSTSGSPADGLILSLPGDAVEPSRETGEQEPIEMRTDAGQAVEAQSIPPTTVEIIPPTPLEPSHPPVAGVEDSDVRAGSPPLAASVDRDALDNDPSQVEPEAAAQVDATSSISPTRPLAETAAPPQPAGPADPPLPFGEPSSSTPSPAPMSSPLRAKASVPLSPAKQPRASSSRPSSAAPSPARSRPSSVASSPVRQSPVQPTLARRARESSTARPDDGSPGYMRPTSAFSHRAGSSSSLASLPSSSPGASKKSAHRSSAAASSSTPARPRSSLVLHRNTPTRPSSRAASATPTPPPPTSASRLNQGTARPSPTSRLFSPTASSLAKTKPKVVLGPSPAQGSPRRSGSLRRPPSAASSAPIHSTHGSPAKTSKSSTGPPSAFRHAARDSSGADDDDPEDGGSARDVRVRGASVSSLASGEGDGRKVQGSPVLTGPTAVGRM